MIVSSPLRYPGGKASLASLLRGVIEANCFGGCRFVEPFAGGGGAAISLLQQEVVAKIRLNDLDPTIYAFWWSALNRSQRFVDMIEQTPISIPQWRSQRAVYNDRRKGKLARGFAAFYLNRCNHSGIIDNGGPIGGVRQKGPWKIGARYHAANLRERIERIAEYRERIEVTNNDAVAVIQKEARSSAFMFIDPPYYQKGQQLYLNGLDHSYHERLAATLKRSSSVSWVVTYDDCPAIRKMYEEWADVRTYTLRYSAAVRRQAAELFIVPRGLRLPKDQRSRAVLWDRDLR